MSDGSKIEWTDATWNPIRARNIATGGVGHFCVHVSEGCRNCYAERMQPRFGNPIRYAAQDLAHAELFLDDKALLQPLRWKKPRKIFVCSMTDLFGEFHSDEWIDQVFAVMALAPQHTFQVLTKRPERMRDTVSRFHRAITTWHTERATGDLGAGSRMIDVCPHLATSFAHPSVDWQAWPLPNVWLGASCEDQPRADARIPHLLATPAAVHFISAEPLLSGIILPPEFLALGRRAWVIAGGESGPGWRDVDPEEFYSLSDQCAGAGVNFFMKQMPGKRPIPADLLVREMPGGPS